MLGKRYFIKDNSEAEPRSWVCTAICKISCEYSARALCNKNDSYDNTLAEYKWSFFSTSSQSG